MNRDIVYRYRWTNESRYTGLAMDCHIRSENERNYLCYYDSLRGHMIEGQVLTDSDTGFTFRSDGFSKGVWHFDTLTIEDFRDWVYKHIENGRILAEKFATTEELNEWYRKEFGFPSE